MNFSQKSVKMSNLDRSGTLLFASGAKSAKIRIFASKVIFVKSEGIAKILTFPQKCYFAKKCSFSGPCNVYSESLMNFAHFEERFAKITMFAEICDFCIFSTFCDFQKEVPALIKGARPQRPLQLSVRGRAQGRGHPHQSEINCN